MGVRVLRIAKGGEGRVKARIRVFPKKGILHQIAAHPVRRVGGVYWLSVKVSPKYGNVCVRARNEAYRLHGLQVASEPVIFRLCIRDEVSGEDVHRPPFPLDTCHTHPFPNKYFSVKSPKAASVGERDQSDLSYRMPRQYREAGAAKGEEEGGAAKVDALIVANERHG